MARTIKNLLKKGNLTGREVGELLLRNLANDIENAHREKKKPPLFTQAEFNQMISGLSAYQYTIYKVLENLYSSIVDNFNFNQAMQQQFYNGYYRYLLTLQGVTRAEEYFFNVEKFPLILTQPQYDRLAQQSIGKKKACKESYFRLFFQVVEFFCNRYYNAYDPDGDGTKEAIPDDIKAAIDVTKGQKVTNKRILANWAEDTDAGYLTLDDGRRSDEMTSKEWVQALEDDFMKHYSLTINGVKQDAETTIKDYNNDLMLHACELLFKGKDAIKAAYKEKSGEDLTDDEADELEQELEDIADRTSDGKEKAHILFGLYPHKRTHWHYYEVPDDYTKYDALMEMLERYNGSNTDRLDNNGKKVKEIPEREQYKEFKDDYPELEAAVKSYLEEHVPATKGLRANQRYKDLVTWEELAELHFLDYSPIEASEEDVIQQFIEAAADTTENLNKHTRAMYHGIAILQNPHYGDKDNNNDYIDPISNDNATKLLHGIDYLESHPEEAEMTEGYLDVLAKPAMIYLYAYNAYIDIIADVYKLGFLPKVVKVDLGYQETQIKAANNILYLLYNTCYGAKEDKKRKRAFLRENFHPIEIEDLRPTEEAKTALKKAMEELGYTKEAAVTYKRWRPLVTSLMRNKKSPFIGEGDEDE